MSAECRPQNVAGRFVDLLSGCGAQKLRLNVPGKNWL